MVRGWGSVRTSRGSRRREAVVVGNEEVDPVFTAGKHRGCVWGVSGALQKEIQDVSKRCLASQRCELEGLRGKSHWS